MCRIAMRSPWQSLAMVRGRDFRRAASRELGEEEAAAGLRGHLRRAREKQTGRESQERALEKELFVELHWLRRAVGGGRNGIRALTGSTISLGTAFLQVQILRCAQDDKCRSFAALRMTGGAGLRSAS